MGRLKEDDIFKELTGEWDYSTLPSNVRIGEGCWLERKGSFDRFRSVRDPGLVIGNRVQAFTWATFNIDPTGLVEIGDDCILVGPVFMCHEHIKIGNRVKISYHVTIADADFHPVDPDLRKLDAIASRPAGDPSERPEFASNPVVIEDDVAIGIGSLILKGVHIGEGALVEPGSVVTRNVLKGTRVAGNPAKPVLPSEAESQ